jgi:hypothetical protein
MKKRATDLSWKIVDLYRAQKITEKELDSLVGAHEGENPCIAPMRERRSQPGPSHQSETTDK